ncbi:Nitrogen regulation protein NR(I), GlnG (=NtrC) [hydrothermal vent metagenome]|uniref:DNA-binding transcriptional regulator NtrC n=1 Tax=hydrothermal vent metagenome TaxID=652676 RepID=A0A3B0XRC6_9ZZZZ
MTKHHIWVVDDDSSIRWVLEKALKSAHFQVSSFETADAALNYLNRVQPDVIITDIRMPGTDGFQFLEILTEKHPEIPAIIMTAHSDLDSAVSAYQGGAFEYLPKPFDIDEVVKLTQRACKKSDENTQKHTPNKSATPDIIGEAPAMQEVFRAIGRLSRSNITVLINGESGTGKELVASALHKHSPRADKPFIAINTAAIPKDLLESELFGHERGAFTGATSQRRGHFEQADGGTLFLDEIGDMPADLQTRLLRVLADEQFYRVGGHTAVKTNVRIITATHQNLEQRVKQGLFREDLFHRLNVIRIHIPALRERKEDIPALLNLFLHRAAKEIQVNHKILLPEVQTRLSSLNWPGNVRQLENICRWITVMASSREIHLSDLPPELLTETLGSAEPSVKSWEDGLKKWAKSQLDSGKQNILGEAQPKFESILIVTALEKTSGKRQDAAKLLGWGRNTLTRKIKELNIKG